MKVNAARSRRIVTGCLGVLLAYHVALTAMAIVANQYIAAFNALDKAARIEPELDRLDSQLHRRLVKSDPEIRCYRKQLESMSTSRPQQPDRGSHDGGVGREGVNDGMPGADPNDPGETKRLIALARDRLSQAAQEAREAQQSLTQSSCENDSRAYRWNWAGIAIVGVGVLGALAIAATMIVCLRSMGPSE